MLKCVYCGAEIKAFKRRKFCSQKCIDKYKPIRRAQSRTMNNSIMNEIGILLFDLNYAKAERNYPAMPEVVLCVAIKDSANQLQKLTRIDIQKEVWCCNSCYRISSVAVVCNCGAEYKYSPLHNVITEALRVARANRVRLNNWQNSYEKLAQERLGNVGRPRLEDVIRMPYQRRNKNVKSVNFDLYGYCY